MTLEVIESHILSHFFLKIYFLCGIFFISNLRISKLFKSVNIIMRQIFPTNVVIGHFFYFVKLQMNANIRTKISQN